MSMRADIMTTFRDAYEKDRLSKQLVSKLYLEVLGSLDWDLFEARDVPFVEYDEKIDLALAEEELFGKDYQAWKADRLSCHSNRQEG